MAEKLPTVKGMNDILPPEVSKWQYVEEKTRAVLEAFAYREIRTPVLEYTPLFVRSVGEVTDVVEKQMYTFDDRDGRSVTLRPEGTAPAVRSYVEQAQWGREPVTRWYYFGPMFRHERAQRGRLRQFHQVGAELFGIEGPSADAEVLAMLLALFEECGLAKDSLTVALNCLGEPEERVAYRDALQGYFARHRDALDDDSRRRLETNPLRILDSKAPEVQALFPNAPLLLDTLGDTSRGRFDEVRNLLAKLGVSAQVDPHLVRGLDYYTATIFEIRTSSGDLGAQNTLGGGGRYDRLVESLGGPRVPALGFAVGLERVLLAMREEAESFQPTLAVFLAPLGDAALAWALPVSHRLRLAGIRVEVEHRGSSLKAQLKRADKMKARFAVIVGDSELAANRVTLRDLQTGKQEDVGAEDLEQRLRQGMD